LKNLKRILATATIAFIATSILATFFTVNPVRAAPTGDEMLFANPSTISRKDLHVNDTITVNISAANMTRVTTLACGLAWDPYYLNLTSVQAGGCIPGGVLLVSGLNWDPVAGTLSDMTYGILGSFVDIPLGLAYICNFKIMHPGASLVDINGMSCWDFDLSEFLVGDSLYDGTVNIIEVRSWPIDYNSDLTVDFYVQTESNSTIATPVNLTIVSQTEGHLFFNITGKTGSKGYTNVTIDQNMLNASSIVDWHTLVDNVDTAESIVSNSTYTFVHVGYNHSDHSIRIIGNKVVPEFPSTALLLLILAIMTAMFFLTRKVHKKPWQATLKR
jgi:hypothetical protein